MILKYQKVTDEHTTYTLLAHEIDVVELVTIGQDTYVYVPDDAVLPEQPFPVETSLEAVALTNELKSEIKAASPHVKLINTRVVDKIREKYTSDDELKMHREFVQNGSTDATTAYIEHVAECRAWGQEQKAAIGLG